MPESCHLFGLFLIHMHGFNQEDIEQALSTQKKHRSPIGQIALKSHLLSLKEVMEVLKIQADSIGVPLCSSKMFGDIAVEYGFLRKANLQILLNMQSSQQPKLGEVLIDAGVLSPARRDQLLSEFHQLIRGSNETTSTV